MLSRPPGLLRNPTPVSSHHPGPLPMAMAPNSNLSSPLHSSQHKHKHPSCCIYILTHYRHISSSHGFQLLPSFWFLSFLTLVLALTLVFLSTIEPSSARVQGTSFFFFFLKIFTCLAASGISCNTQDLCVSSFVLVRGLSSCGSQA